MGGIAGAFGFNRLGYVSTLPLALLLISLALVPMLDDLRSGWRRFRRPPDLAGNNSGWTSCALSTHATSRQHRVDNRPSDFCLGLRLDPVEHARAPAAPPG